MRALFVSAAILIAGLTAAPGVSYAQSDLCIWYYACQGGNTGYCGPGARSGSVNTAGNHPCGARNATWRQMNDLIRKGYTVKWGYCSRNSCVAQQRWIESYYRQHKRLPEPHMLPR